MPKMIMVSNYINHHQIPFCNAMYRLLGGAFAFCQTEPMEKERVRMGWQEQAELPYLILYEEDSEKYQKWIDDCQVVFFGGTNEEKYIQTRLREHRPVIRYSERIYKEAQWKAISPRGLRKKYLDHTRYRRRPVYMLCSGAYVPSDFSIVKAYPGKLLRWGYFPETRHYDVDKLMQTKKTAHILWAARCIGLKHPELPVETARYLRDKGLSFHMDIIGGGEYAPLVAELVEKYELKDYVTLWGFKTPAEVREFMEQADIYLMTSDRNEGWGAVVNEAMNSGCVVVGNHMVGAVPFLIRHGENGLIYKDGCAQQLFERTESLIKDREYCHRLGRQAYATITEEWNAENAAQQLCSLCCRQSFLCPEDLPGMTEDEQGRIKAVPKEGPCSAAPVISERAMYSRLVNHE